MDTSLKLIGKIHSSLKKIETRAWEIKKELAERVKHQLRRMPVLHFYSDDTLEHVFKMEELFKQIMPPTPEGEKKINDKSTN